jgi:hydroxymethylpyrimidine pyrophosphatase-like HAD family hydrolase
MRYLALACDYDGTIATHGRVDDDTIAALKRLRASGRELILVSGRELEDLQSVFPHLDLFAIAVLENGALLYWPATKEEKVLAGPPPAAFIDALRRRNVQGFSVGRAIVAAWRPDEAAVLDAIHECHLELQIIFNKDAVMVLPAGVNKATGLSAALSELGLSPHNVAGVGDAENDHAFLTLCECGAAVANALEAVKQTADVVLAGDHGRGVAELIDELVENDLREHEGKLARRLLLFGHREDGREVRLRPYGTNLLFAGPPGSSKGAATSFLERLGEAKYQFCIIDPEGDFSSFEGALTLGTAQHGPAVAEVLQALANPDRNVVVNLAGLGITDRPGFFLALLPRLSEMRARVGRPHWLVVDEAHHLFPASWGRGALALPFDLDRAALITVHPGQVHASILSAVDTVVAVGASPTQTLAEFCDALAVPCPEGPTVELAPGEVLLWERGAAPYRVRSCPPHVGGERPVRLPRQGKENDR